MKLNVPVEVTTPPLVMVPALRFNVPVEVMTPPEVVLMLDPVKVVLEAVR